MLQEVSNKIKFLIIYCYQFIILFIKLISNKLYLLLAFFEICLKLFSD